MTEENVAPGRIGVFKNKGRNADEMRRRRTTASIELRKASRDEQMLKRRSLFHSDVLQALNENASNGNEMLPLHEIFQVLQQNDRSRLFEAVQSARKILSREKHPPIDDLINCGIVPRLVSYLSSEYEHDTKLQFEACWALTNIASGNSEQTSSVIKEGAIPKLVDLLQSPEPSLVEQATWALGNIAGDGAEARDLVLSAGALETLLLITSDSQSVGFLRTAVWTISNLCRNKNPAPPFEIVRKCLPLLRDLINYDDTEIVADACWAISYLTDGHDWQIQEIVDSHILPRLVQLLKSTQISILTPALRSVGNVVTGNEAQTDAALKAGALPLLKNLLQSSRGNIVKEAAWSISNITAGTPAQIQAVIDAGILPIIISVLVTGDFKAQKEAAYVITNFTSNATNKQLEILILNNVLPPFCNLLGNRDVRVVLVALDGLHNLLYKAEAIGQIDVLTQQIEECGGLDKLEALQQHDQGKVYEKAYAIIDTFFGVEDEELADIVPSSTVDQYEFNPADPSGRFNF